MPTKSEQTWDALTDVQCAEGRRRRNSAIVQNKSGWHVALNKRKLFSEYTPKVAEKTRPQGLVRSRSGTQEAKLGHRTGLSINISAWQMEKKFNYTQY